MFLVNNLVASGDYVSKIGLITYILGGQESNYESCQQFWESN